jgi:anti-anti-sigma factor
MAGYTIDHNHQACKVQLAGDFTASILPELQGALKKEFEAGANEVEFDLGKTQMLDSSAIGLLIATCNSIGRRKGKIRVINVSPEIQRLFQSMRLVSRLDVSGPSPQE